ncbi:uncharacterized protein LOC113779914 [Coffea eugenioides]|uniref:uncharacterized protein LOC113779914 n=1 Tax=Coffea eugenioides TaxID=49369 RepID=UPI000F60E672|nr:uncharacterized protein LOC113779914 [Coffea eugenioides]
MGGKLSILENRTYYSIELRMWVHPARPDKFEKIIRIKPGGSIRVKAKQGLLDFDKVLVMVYANGVWTGNYIFPLHLMTYAKVICDRNQHGGVIIRGKRAFNFCRLKCFAFIPAKYVGLGMIEEEI